MHEQLSAMVNILIIKIPSNIIQHISRLLEAQWEISVSALEIMKWQFCSSADKDTDVADLT